MIRLSTCQTISGQEESCILDIFKLSNLVVSLLDKEIYHKVLVTKLWQDCLDGFLAEGCQKCVLNIERKYVFPGKKFKTHDIYHYFFSGKTL